MSRLEDCSTCKGTGVKAGTVSSTCATCKGNGQVVQAVRTPLGMFQQVATCPTCNGTGEQFTPCSSCQGDGRVRGTKRISLRVPPGVDEGSRLRVRGEGDAGRRSGEPGDLYVFIGVKAHPSLRREGVTIHSGAAGMAGMPAELGACWGGRAGVPLPSLPPPACARLPRGPPPPPAPRPPGPLPLPLPCLADVEISYVDAILGTTVKVTTLGSDSLSEVDLKIPAGTQPGTTLVMSKRGVPKLGSSARGDHLVHVKVKIPKTISGDERKLMEQLRELQASKPAASRGWF